MTTAACYIRGLDTRDLPALFPHCYRADSFPQAGVVWLLIAEDGEPLCSYASMTDAVADAAENSFLLATLH